MRDCVDSNVSIQSWYNFCRDICSKYLLEFPTSLGGDGVIVEIDETHFGAKRKYGRGRCNPGLDKWVFGAVDRSTKEVLMWVVPNRRRATLQPLIERHILPNSIIHSDTWAPYFNLPDLGRGYVHHMVNHTREFVTPEGVHTNGIECEWGVIKAEMKIMRGVRENQLPAFIDEHIYRKKFRNDDIFTKLIGHVSHFYAVNDA